MSAARVTFVCQWYPPEPVEIPAGIVDALRHEGLQMQVLTGIPNYPSGEVMGGYAAHSVVREVHDGVPVLRAPLYPSHDTSAVRRLVNYASWALSAAVIGQGRLRASDVGLVYSSPATAALPAMVAKALWGTPFVLLVQDVWPDSIFASGFLNGRLATLARRIIEVFVCRSYAMADHVMVISPGMVDLLGSRGVPLEKLSVVYNWLPDEVTDRAWTDRGLLRRRAGLEDDARVFLYAGNHGRAQALDALVDAFADPRTEPAHLVLVGAGVTKASLMARTRSSERVHFLDPVTRAEAGELVAAADVTVVSLADHPLFAVTMPSKVQSGLAAGRPVLVVSRGDSADIVRKNDAGVSARPGDVSSIVEAVASLCSMSPDELTEMGQRGSTLYRETMARAVGASRMADVLTRTVSRSPRGWRRNVEIKGSRHV